MSTFKTRWRWFWLGTVLAAVIACVAVLWLRPMLDEAIRVRIESAAARHGVIAQIGHARVGVWPLVRLESVDLGAGHGVRLHADTVAISWHGRPRLAVRTAALVGPAGIAVGAPASTWDVAGIRGGELQLALVEPKAGLTIRKRTDPDGSSWNVEAHGLDVGHLFDVRRDGRPLVDGGVVDGQLAFQAVGDALHFQVDMSARGARLGLLADNSTDEPQLGDPTDVALKFDGAWRRIGGTIEIPEFHAMVAGAAVAGSIALRDLDTDPNFDVAVGVQHLDFAQVLGASGLAVPESLGIAPGSSPDLGSVTIDLHVRGRLADPASLSVSQKIDFSPPHVMPPGIARLRGDFVFGADEGAGKHRAIDVSAASPDFIALHEVPSLFVRTLLISEDAGFYGHHGIDLRELPVALLTDWSRGGAARGASTVSQQLAKNLFLSWDKQVGRKLQELAITLLLESALGKSRILEIYLNIIEWGPDLRGLRPAARKYFGREPQALTPAQMAFLVSIIPAPIKYQVSFAHGSPGPGLTSLIDALLGKLRSVGAIGEEEYRQALDEPLVVAGSKPPG